MHDVEHRALRGSECQVQLYVNSCEQRALLEQAARNALPSLDAAGVSALDWRPPLQRPLFDGDHPFHEYRDGKLFDAVERPDLRKVWTSYWPVRSQRWDAVAIARDASGAAVGPVLVEGKSYPAEFRPTSGGTRAEDDRLRLIERRLRETRECLGVAETPELAKLWLGPLYQSANRFATLCFFRSFCDPPAEAWLLNLYFVNDTTHTNRTLATSQEQWETSSPLSNTTSGSKARRCRILAGRIWRPARTRSWWRQPAAEGAADVISSPPTQPRRYLDVQRVR